MFEYYIFVNFGIAWIQYEYKFFVSIEKKSVWEMDLREPEDKESKKIINILFGPGIIRYKKMVLI